MGWDRSRPVPWERLMREWVIYAGIMAAIFLVLFRSGGVIGAIAGLLISGPLYLAFGYAMAKFGYQRKTMKQLRAERDAREAEPARESTGDVGSARRTRPAPTRRTRPAPTRRTRPAPTRRTSRGPNRPVRRKRR